MKFKNIPKFILAGGILSLVSACDITDLDINQDLNRPPTATVKLLLPSAESAAVNALTSLSQNSLGFAGLLSSSDNYDLNNQSYNGTWNSFYLGMNNVEAVINASANSPHYLGIGQTLKALAVGNFVDMFGDVPYTEAWKGNAAEAIEKPKFDKDSDIYEALIKLCDQAVINLSKTSPVSVATEGGDFLYKGVIAKWIKLAKTVKIKLLLTSRKGRASGNADLKAALAAGGYITDPVDDFVYKYSTASAPEGRHPWFTAAYLADNGFAYPSHQLMSEMIFSKDPRLDFYFYRQTDKILDPSNPTDRGTIPYGGSYLVLKPAFWERWNQVFGKPSKADSSYVAGFFGRDRGDNTGVPQDGALRTAPGSYPAGGLYGGRSVVPKALTGGRGAGNGIWPLLTSNNVKFYQIESILDGGGDGNARAIFESAIKEHIKRVVDLGLSVDAANAKAPVSSDIDAYVENQLQLFDAATSNNAKLNIVMKQMWFCSWGQGNEIWNALRRTGYPSNINNPIIRPARQFALRLPYPSQEGILNSNATPKLTEIIFDRDPVFWDKVKLKWEF
jgi:hypothetical protein